MIVQKKLQLVFVSSRVGLNVNIDVGHSLYTAQITLTHSTSVYYDYTSTHRKPSAAREDFP